MPTRDGGWEIVELSQAGVYAYQQMALDTQLAAR
jgi:hypothetical protein